MAPLPGHTTCVCVPVIPVLFLRRIEDRKGKLTQINFRGRSSKGKDEGREDLAGAGDYTNYGVI